jgi:hypothetical protein
METPGATDGRDGASSIPRQCPSTRYQPQPAQVRSAILGKSRKQALSRSTITHQQTNGLFVGCEKMDHKQPVHARDRGTTQVTSRSYHIKAPEDDMKYGLLWLLGVPIPILIIGYLLFH